MKRIYLVFTFVLLGSVAFGQSRTQRLTFTKHVATAGAYAASDVVGDSTILNWTNAGRQGVIQSAVLSADSINVANGTFRLWLFNDTSFAYTSMVRAEDNAAFVLTDSMTNNLVGYINFTLITGGAGSTGTASYVTDVNMGYNTKNGSLFGVLTATAAYVPAYLGKFRIALTFRE